MACISLSKPMTAVVKVFVLLGISLGGWAAQAADPVPAPSIQMPWSDPNTPMRLCEDAKAKATAAISEVAGYCGEKDLKKCRQEAAKCNQELDIIETEFGTNSADCGEIVPPKCPARAGKLYQGAKDEQDDAASERRDLQSSIESLQDQVAENRVKALESQQQLQTDINDKRKEQKDAAQQAMKALSDLDKAKTDRMTEIRRLMRTLDKQYNQVDKELTAEQRRIRSARNGIFASCEKRAYDNRDAVKSARAAYLQQTGQAIGKSSSNQVTGSKKKRQGEFTRIIKECLHQNRKELQALDQDAEKALQLAQKAMADIETDRALLIKEMNEFVQSLEGEKQRLAKELTTKISDMETELATIYQQGMARLQVESQNMSETSSRLAQKEQELQTAKIREAGAKSLARCTRSYSDDYKEKITNASNLSKNYTNVVNACGNMPANCTPPPDCPKFGASASVIHVDSKPSADKAE